ncbi:molybdenum cofactor biosysynthesis protein [Streptomyces sp. MMG1121]|uniref:molybdenum cofactor biosysynthesis protein n=1 Tax=Streptomyces sp. MMG1121 TaxID=1415544 RepID=UPI000B26CE5D|nr:molybdenum cofactor biosysynthesis protein [Streptomyces sp. MMG1121]
MPRIEILQLLVSPVHRLAGRPGDGIPELPPADLVRRAEVRAGRGLVGDRYFNHPAHRNASLTLMAVERLPRPGPGEPDLLPTRRNVLLRGVDIDAYLGATVFLDCGTGPVELAVRSAARPCAWVRRRRRRLLGTRRRRRASSHASRRQTSHPMKWTSPARMSVRTFMVVLLLAVSL